MSCLGTHADCVVVLQLSMLDGKKYAAMHETGEDIASCELFLTPKVGLVVCPINQSR